MWRDYFHVDPLPVLLSAHNAGLIFHMERDLLNQHAYSIERVWESTPVLKILKEQLPDGSWYFKGNRPGEEIGENYELVETWKVLRQLVGKYAFDRSHPAMEKAAAFVFSCQSEEGDIRGILSNQYAPYYTGALLELLIKAGYGDDNRVLYGLDWLLSMQQDDGGWIVPLNMFKQTYYYEVALKDPIPPRKELPSSHMASGMVLRAFAAHPEYKKKKEMLKAGEFMAERLFKKDAFTFRQAPEYWFKLQYPFWWTNLLSALQTLSALGFISSDPRVRKGLEWFRENQKPDGTWTSSYDGKDPEADLWITFAVCRMVKAFLG